MGPGRLKKHLSFVEFNHKHPDRLALAELGASSGSVEIGSLAFPICIQNYYRRTPSPEPRNRTPKNPIRAKFHLVLTFAVQIWLNMTSSIPDSV